MGQGFYRCVGWGCLNPPPFDWDGDSEKPSLFDALLISDGASLNYIMIPFGVDDSILQEEWSLAPLPKGLPHAEPYTAVTVKRCKWWPDIGKRGVWVSDHIVVLWELVRIIARQRGLELPAGEPIFVCDWD